MAERLFGTDGIRGLANVRVTPELALALGTAVAASLPAGSSVVVGADTRPSSPLLVAALSSGLAAGGVTVLDVGVAPTPAVAHVVAAGHAAAGVVVSASHNPAADNGLKVFGTGGFKLDDAAEAALEALIARGPADRPTGFDVGLIRDRRDLLEAYSADLLATLPHRLDGLKIVVDCAHGAASTIAPALYRTAGAEVITIANGDGAINDGVGATHLDAVRAAVREHGADAGIAHDGDADRCLAVAADGSDVDGDAILAILAIAGRAPAVVTTVMANLGFHHAMRDAGIEVVTTPVGDRYVLEEMRARRITLGGEQSGHVVLLEQATTGDGLLTALHLLSRLAESGSKLADLASIVQRLPQVLRGVRADRGLMNAAIVEAAIDAETATLGDVGRVLVRASGTEPLIRVMVEAPTMEQAEAICERLCMVISDAAS